MNRERNCLYAITMLTVLALVCLSECLRAQSLIMPAYLSQDPAYWWGKYNQESARADGLHRSGEVAINGLKASLDVANQTIAKQNAEIVRQTTRADREQGGREKAETALKPTADELARLKGRTWVGRGLRKARDGLAVVGGAALIGLALALTL